MAEGPATEEVIVGYVWARYECVEDGEGGFLFEPQDRMPVRVRDLAPGLRRLVLASKLKDDWDLWAGPL